MFYQKNSKFNYLSRLIAACLYCCWVLFSSPLWANNTPHIAVLYPQSSARVSQLYNTIIKNMRQRNHIEIIARKFSNNENADDIQQWLAAEKIQALILLGEKGFIFSTQLNLKIPIITGAHLGVKTNRSAVSLAADPLQLFQNLKKLKPNIKQVNVIYNEVNTGWLIKKARLAAKKNHLKLNAIQSDSVQTSAQALKKLLDNVDAKKDAIWLPYDPILPIKHLLPNLLRKSWQENLTVFSGNPYHVQQGVLFALFPDYSKLGQQLIDLALLKIHKNSSVRYEPSRYLYSAINVRTAAHLGIQLSHIKQDNYKMVFPKK